MAAAQYAVHTQGGESHFRIYIGGGFADAKHTKPTAALHVYDLLAGTWVPHNLKLATARGAAMMARGIGAGGTSGLVVGGVLAGGGVAAAADVIGAEANAAPTLSKPANPSKDGRVFGGAVTMSSGQVLIAGGASGTAKGLVANTTLRLWKP